MRSRVTNSFIAVRYFTHDKCDKFKLLILYKKVGTKFLSQNQITLPRINRGMWQNPNTTNIASKTYDCLAA